MNEEKIQQKIQQEINNIVPQMIDNAVSSHDHSPSNSQLILGSNLANAPQSALTSATAGSLTSGGSNDLKTSDSTIITNAILRISQLESKLKALGFLN